MPQKKSTYHHLKKKWEERHGEVRQKLSDKHKDVVAWAVDNPRQLVAGTLSGFMMLVNPALPTLAATPSAQVDQSLIQDLDKKIFVISDLDKAVPDEVRPLTHEEEENIAIVLNRHFGIKVAAELEGKRLNRSYGFIGAEQHLMRYPGDTMNTHFDNPDDASKYWSSGMAPGRGAWGYFAPSHAEMTEEDVAKEKYYIAVQTFLADGYNSRLAEYRDFFKHRKMLVVNPHNGKAVVVVIGDAGPAVWTGKHLGGSPEVMKHLERVDGRARGPVLYFFVDDPNNSIPLGPVEI